MIPRLLLPLLLLGAALAGAQEWQLFHARGADTAALTGKVAPLLPQGVSLRLCEVPPTCSSEPEAQLHAAALTAGVGALPSLVLQDARGAYAALHVSELTPSRVQQAAALATAPERAETARRREITGQLFLLRYALSCAATAEEQDARLAAMRELMLAPDTPADMRQLIGLHCLYPAILHQYATEYRTRGAHSPRTEKKLLEAISALESARDADRSSPLGQRAHAERERLRAARLKSRQYE